MLSAKRSRIQAAAVALCFMYYNLDRIHRTLRTAAAMAAGATTEVWEIGGIVAFPQVEEKHYGREGGS